MHQQDASPPTLIISIKTLALLGDQPMTPAFRAGVLDLAERVFGLACRKPIGVMTVDGTIVPLDLGSLFQAHHDLVDTTIQSHLTIRNDVFPEPVRRDADVRARRAMNKWGVRLWLWWRHWRHGNDPQRWREAVLAQHRQDLGRNLGNAVVAELEERISEILTDPPDELLGWVWGAGRVPGHRLGQVASQDPVRAPSRRGIPRSRGAGLNAATFGGDNGRPCCRDRPMLKTAALVLLGLLIGSAHAQDRIALGTRAMVTLSVVRADLPEEAWRPQDSVMVLRGVTPLAMAPTAQGPAFQGELRYDGHQVRLLATVDGEPGRLEIVTQAPLGDVDAQAIAARWGRYKVSVSARSAVSPSDKIDPAVWGTPDAAQATR